MQPPQLEEVLQNYALWKDYSDKVEAVVRNASQIIKESRELQRHSVVIEKLINVYVNGDKQVVEFEAKYIRKVDDGKYVYEDQNTGLRVLVYERFYCNHYESELIHLFTLTFKGVTHEGSVDL